jgi:hypothetical protein
VTSPSYYTPQSPSVLDIVGYTQRVVDAILRNNPLHNASVDSGLMRWLGNYTNTDGSRINHLWIGEFYPADPNLPGDPPQRGFSLVRDDSQGGQYAFALYDHNPSAGDGLRQTIHFRSGDGEQLAIESRQGGWYYPEENVWMGSRDSDLALWPGTDSASYSTIYEGRVNVIGTHLRYRVWNACTGGAAGNFRFRVQTEGGDLVSAVHSLPANANGVLDSELDIRSARGRVIPVYLEAQRTNGVGKVRSSVISVRCSSDP